MMFHWDTQHRMVSHYQMCTQPAVRLNIIVFA